MSKRYDVVAAMGEFQDREGNKKVRWQNCGAVFEKDGKLSMKLDLVPVGNTWEGWFKLFEPQQNEPQRNRGTAPKASQNDGFEYEIPF